jgi:hypothetical protein
MPVSAEAKSYAKAIVVALFGVVAAALGIFAVGAFGDYFEANPVYAPLMLTGSLGIDISGALIPLVTALIAVGAFFKLAKDPLKRVALAFSVSAALAFGLCHQTPDGVAGYPLLYAFIISMVVAGLSLYPKPNSELRKNFAASLMLTLFCVPISLIIVDLAYSTSFCSSVVGGNGLTDGLILSTLYAPMAMVAVFSGVAYVSQTVLFVKNNNTAGKFDHKTRTNNTFRE